MTVRPQGAGMRMVRRRDQDRVTVYGICAVSLATSVASLAISIAVLVAVQ